VGVEVSDSLEEWLSSLDERERAFKDVEPTNVFVQLDALREERIERGDPHWWPSGPDPQGLERLVRDRVARGTSPRTR
jgi:hypothetical protein